MSKTNLIYVSTAGMKECPEKTSTDTEKSSNDSEKQSQSKDEPKSFWKEQWYSFGQDIPVSGLRYVSDPEQPKLRRILWTTLIAMGLGVMSYQMSLSILEYYERNTQVDITFEFLTKIQFPTVTFCNENRIRRDRARALGIEDDILMLAPPYRSPGRWTPYVNTTQMQDMVARMNALFPDWLAFYDNVTSNITDYFVDCKWCGMGCDASWFTESYTPMGKCFTFNADGKWPSTGEGNMFGLQLLLFVDQENYLMTQNMIAGYRMSLDFAGDAPSAVTNGFLVSPGFTTSVKIGRTEHTYLEPPYGPCVTNRQLQLFPSSYTRSNCQRECFLDYLHDKCGCYLLGTPNVPASSICDLWQELNCTSPAIMGFSHAGVICDCPPSCTEVAYTEDISIGVIADYVQTYLALNVSKDPSMDADYFQDNLASVQMYYPVMSVTRMDSTIDYSLVMLFNDIGGALGLMLGSTFLTVYEAMEFFVWAAWQRRKLQRKVTA